MQANRILNKLWTFPQNNLEIAHWLAKKHTMVLHASCVVVNNKCLVFLGNSGMGKSTLAKFFYARYGEKSVLNDDLIAVQVRNGQIIIYGTPWVGKKTKQETAIAHTMRSKTYIATKTHDVYWYSIVHSKHNNASRELTGVKKMRVILHGLWGNHVFISPEQVDVVKKQVLSARASKKEQWTYQRCLQLTDQLRSTIRLFHCGCRKSEGIIDYLLKF